MKRISQSSVPFFMILAITFVLSVISNFALAVDQSPPGEMIVYAFISVASFVLICMLLWFVTSMEDIFDCFRKFSEQVLIDDRNQFNKNMGSVANIVFVCLFVLSTFLFSVCLFQIFSYVNNNPLDFSSQGVWVCGNQMERNQIFFRPAQTSGNDYLVPVLVANEVKLENVPVSAVTKDGFKVSVSFSATLSRYRIPDSQIVSMVKNLHHGLQEKGNRRGAIKDRLNRYVADVTRAGLTRMVSLKIEELTLAEVCGFYPESNWLGLQESSVKILRDELALDWNGWVKMVVTEMPVKN